MDSNTSNASSIPKPAIINGTKTFIPLENNPETLEELSLLLGLQKISFHDILSLTDPTVNPPIPRPVHALIFLCPTSIWAPFHPDVPARTIDFTRPITWFPQTIGHACGLIALIHAVANIPASSLSDHVPSSSPLASILKAAPDISPEDRAKLLYDSLELERAHMTAASRGDSHAPSPHDENHHHFMCFVKGGDGDLWEIEGMRAGVRNSGPMRNGEDVLSERILARGPGKYVEEGEKKGESMFSCVAVCLE